MKILLTNDDGVHAEGISVLRKTLETHFDVYVIAPLEERSTTGHTVTLDGPLRFVEIEKNVFGCSGYPADCVLMGLGHLFKDKFPDLVVSGINRGANLGQDTYYSGTVAGAREAAFHGVPSIAVSTVTDFIKPKEKIYYESAAEMVLKLLQNDIKKEIPEMGLLNINVPDVPSDEVKGLVVKPLGFRKYSEVVEERIDCRNRPYYWLAGSYLGFNQYGNSDCESLSEGHATLTPIKLLNEMSENAATLEKKIKEMKF